MTNNNEIKKITLASVTLSQAFCDQLVTNLNTKNSIHVDDTVNKDALKAWKQVLASVKDVMYNSVRAKFLNTEMTKEESDAFYSAVKDVYNFLNNKEVFRCNDKTLDVWSGFVAQIKNVPSPELAQAKSELRKLNKELLEMETSTTVTYAESVKSAKAEAVKIAQALVDGLDIPENYHKELLPISDETFRRSVETHLGSMLTNFKSKSAEEIRAEKKARNKKTQARKNAKKAAEKKSESTK